MSQLDNFRKSLGLPTPEDEKKTAAAGKRSVTLREDTYQKCKAILFWMSQHSSERATIDSLVNTALDLFLKENSGAKQFYDSSSMLP